MSEASIAGTMSVSSLIADNVSRIRSGATLLEVADALAADDVGMLVVGEDDKPQGVVSERDLVTAIANRRPLDATTALDVASTELVWCDATATVAEVAEEMAEHYVRHVLVERDGRLVGIVSARDLLGVYAAADVELDL